MRISFFNLLTFLFLIYVFQARTESNVPRKSETGFSSQTSSIDINFQDDSLEDDDVDGDDFYQISWPSIYATGVDQTHSGSSEPSGKRFFPGASSFILISCLRI